MILFSLSVWACLVNYIVILGCQNCICLLSLDSHIISSVIVLIVLPLRWVVCCVKSWVCVWICHHNCMMEKSFKKSKQLLALVFRCLTSGSDTTDIQIFMGRLISDCWRSESWMTESFASFCRAFLVSICIWQSHLAISPFNDREVVQSNARTDHSGCKAEWIIQ